MSENGRLLTRSEMKFLNAGGCLVCNNDYVSCPCCEQGKNKPCLCSQAGHYTIDTRTDLEIEQGKKSELATLKAASHRFTVPTGIRFDDALAALLARLNRPHDDALWSLIRGSLDRGRIPFEAELPHLLGNTYEVHFPVIVPADIEHVMRRTPYPPYIKLSRPTVPNLFALCKLHAWVGSHTLFVLWLAYGNKLKARYTNLYSIQFDDSVFGRGAEQAWQHGYSHIDLLYPALTPDLFSGSGGLVYIDPQKYIENSEYIHVNPLFEHVNI